MVSKIVIYKNGHFYDKQTNERFELVNDAELAIKHTMHKIKQYI